MARNIVRMMIKVESRVLFTRPPCINCWSQAIWRDGKRSFISESYVALKNLLFANDSTVSGDGSVGLAIQLILSYGYNGTSFPTHRLRCIEVFGMKRRVKLLIAS